MRTDLKNKYAPPTYTSTPFADAQGPSDLEYLHTRRIPRDADLVEPDPIPNPSTHSARWTILTASKLQPFDVDRMNWREFLEVRRNDVRTAEKDAAGRRLLVDGRQACQGDLKIIILG